MDRATDNRSVLLSYRAHISAEGSRQNLWWMVKEVCPRNGHGAGGDGQLEPLEERVRRRQSSSRMFRPRGRVWQKLPTLKTTGIFKVISRRPKPYWPRQKCRWSVKYHIEPHQTPNCSSCLELTNLIIETNGATPQKVPPAGQIQRRGQEYLLPTLLDCRILILPPGPSVGKGY